MDGLSFYDIGGYRENVRRYKEGIEQLCDVQTMIKVLLSFIFQLKLKNGSALIKVLFIFLLVTCFYFSSTVVIWSLYVDVFVNV